MRIAAYINPSVSQRTGRTPALRRRGARFGTIGAMRATFLGLLAWVLGSPAAWAVSGDPVVNDQVTARLVAETQSIAPGETVWVALDLTIRDGWHTYWRNPGDSGQPTRIDWKLPAGFTASDILWPTPHRFEVPPLVNYGYAGHVLHLVKVTAPASLAVGAPARLEAQANWLVCSDVCIPQSATLALTLPTQAAPGSADPALASAFAAARADLPRAAPGPVTATLGDGHLTLTLGPEWGAARTHIHALAFFPYDDGVIEYAAPQTLEARADTTTLSLKLGYQPPKSGPIRGVLLATEGEGQDNVTSSLEISAPMHGAAPTTAATSAAAPAVAAPAVAAATSAMPQPAPAGGGERFGLASLLGFALLGGLILNLMPCVFPVLSIKAIGLVEQAKKHPAAVRAKGLTFAAGVVASMLALAAALLALRAGGEQIGWGFQLQSPLFVTFMVYLLLAVGLNLSGVFEIGGGLAGVGDGLTRGEGYRAAFFTGVLTTLVATPCTAPFMAAAIGAALTQSPAAALAIFAALGVGLSLPYLLICFAPWLRGALPRPGAWMDTLKQLFAFPMYASAAWLLWVLAQQTSPLGLGAALAGAVLVALAAWAYQRAKSSGHRGRLTALAAATAALALAVVLPLKSAGVAVASATTTGGTSGAAAAAGGEEWQAYDPAKVAALVAAGRPVLVNFTASWCLTCLVNERNAFADPDVRDVFRRRGVTLVKGDWTNRDPVITRALADFGRAGVPLYVVYNGTPGAATPKVLPQLLTAGVVREAFGP